MKVNLIVPVYNVAPYIQQFMNSLVRQTCQDFDVVIVDDKSPDNSIDIVQQYARYFDTRLKIVRHERNLGLCGARNTGLNHIAEQGEYVLFLDPDDYLEPTCLEEMVKAADESAADITICGLERFDDKTGKTVCTEMVSNPEEAITEIAGYKGLAYMNPVVWNKLYRKSIVAATRFTAIKRSEDTVFLFSILPDVKRIKFVNRVLYHYRLRSDSLSGAITPLVYNSMLAGFEKTVRSFEKAPDRYKKIKDPFEVQIFIRCGLGGTCRLAFRDMKKAGRYIRHTKAYMDRVIPDWRRNHYLTVYGFWKRDLKQNALMAAALLYKTNLFILFVWAYWFLLKVIKKDIRW